MMETTDLRLLFEKKGRAKYISHLDLSAAMSRAFVRSGVPVYYTQGFHPHIYLNFLLPLSLGYESSCEMVDFRVEATFFDPAQILESLRKVLPEGLRPLAVYPPTMKGNLIAFAKYRIVISFDDIGNNYGNAIADYFAQNEILAVKKTKRQEISVDLAKLCKVQIIETNAVNATFDAVLPAGNESINPSVLLDSLCDYLYSPYDSVSVERLFVYDENMAIFH